VVLVVVVDMPQVLVEELQDREIAVLELVTLPTVVVVVVVQALLELPSLMTAQPYVVVPVETALQRTLLGELRLVREKIVAAPDGTQVVVRDRAKETSAKQEVLVEVVTSNKQASQILVVVVAVGLVPLVVLELLSLDT
jgi:hypothetical protein